AAQERLKFGALTEITGGAAQLGANALAGYRLAIKEINESGGILGKQVDLVIGDNQTDPTHAVSEATRLVAQERIMALVGPSLSQLALAVMPITTKANILQISTAGSTLATPD